MEVPAQISSTATSVLARLDGREPTAKRMWTNVLLAWIHATQTPFARMWREATAALACQAILVMDTAALTRTNAPWAPTTATSMPCAKTQQVASHAHAIKGTKAMGRNAVMQMNAPWAPTTAIPTLFAQTLTAVTHVAVLPGILAMASRARRPLMHHRHLPRARHRPFRLLVPLHRRLLEPQQLSRRL
jgi:hypothetical protein